MTNTPEQELRNILQFCEGYEADIKERAHDYNVLKKHIQKRLKELEGGNNEI